METTKEYPKRKGLRSGARTEFTVIGNVKPGHEQALREAIKRRAADPRRIEDAKKFGTIHEARVDSHRQRYTAPVLQQLRRHVG